MGNTLEYVPQKFKNDKEFVLTALKTYPLSFRYADEEFREVEPKMMKRNMNVKTISMSRAEVILNPSGDDVYFL